MKSPIIAASALALSSLFATSALACVGAECAYAPASGAYAFAPPAPYQQQQTYQAQAYYQYAPAPTYQSAPAYGCAPNVCAPQYAPPQYAPPAPAATIRPPAMWPCPARPRLRWWSAWRRRLKRRRPPV